VEKGRKREDGAAIDKRCAFCQKWSCRVR
jgi:hypothetical protein